MSSTIEDASPSDAEGIARVHVESMRASHGEFVPATALQGMVEPGAPGDVDAEGRGPRGRAWRGWIERSRADTVVARDGARIVGFCALHREPGPSKGQPVGELPSLHVLSSHWRMGLGRGLMATLMQRARERGSAELVLWVLEANERARRFSADQGFRAVGSTRVFLEHRGDVLRELRLRREVGEEHGPPPSA